MKIITSLLPLFLIASLSSCSSLNDYSYDENNDEDFFDEYNVTTIEEKTNSSDVNHVLTRDNKISIHQRMNKLANALFSHATDIELSQSVAIGTFLPIQLTNSPNLAEQNYIGLQIQESLITLATQAGLNVVEFKTASAIKITTNADVMLSRSTKELQRDVNAQYFLTGTYSEQSNQLMVNARIIELSTQRVIAAATDYMPMPSLENTNKITMKDNMLHREAF